MAVEVELRSFLTEQKYNELLRFFRINGKFMHKENQITHYLDDSGNLRIQKSDKFAKVWLKEGELHAIEHHEMEARFPREDFEELEKIFTIIGKPTRIKWIRSRHNFKWNGANVMLDYTKGYGHILELEILCQKKDVPKAKRKLAALIASLKLKPTPKAEFDKKYRHYIKNWKKLVK
ncbi:MAG: CYTH domain-containing protein [Candidatus Micrarchaeota archaeon]|nr:CYTH domain-containing protein [Candidatus Micrarchaeota archaeon]